MEYNDKRAQPKQRKKKMMVRIAVVDDEQECSDMLVAFVDRYFSKIGEQYELTIGRAQHSAHIVLRYHDTHIFMAA